MEGANSSGMPTISSERMEMNSGCLKVAILGHKAVGKTAILNRHIYHTFSNEYEPSRTNMYSNVMEWEGSQLGMEIIDVPGGTDFDFDRHKAIKDSEAFILVYSVDKSLSFQEVFNLREAIFNEKEAGVPIVVVENKLDLPRVRWFKGASIIPKVMEAGWGVPHLQLSAKEETDVSDIFDHLVFDAQKGLRRPSRGSRTISAYNVIQDVLLMIEAEAKK